MDPPGSMPARRALRRLSLAEVRPYGAWASPITAASLAEGAIGLADLRVADGKVRFIHDFRYVPYIMQDARIELA